MGWAGQEMRPTLQSESKPTGAQPKNMHIKRKAYFGRTDQGLRELPGMLHTIRYTYISYKNNGYGEMFVIQLSVK